MGPSSAPPPQKGAKPSVFCAYLLWPNGWMDQDATWQGSRPRPRPHTVVSDLSVCLCVCFVCDVGVLWPNGWMDQDETWHGSRLIASAQATLLDGNPAPGHRPQFSVHICCGQMAGWIKMPLGREIGLSPSDIVLDGDPAPLSERGHSPPIFDPCLLWPNGWMDQDATW